jgi:hypothetical protein
MRSLMILLLLSSPLSAESWLDTLLGKSESGCMPSQSSEYPIQQYPATQRPSKLYACYSCPKGMVNNIKVTDANEQVPLCCDETKYPKICMKISPELDPCRIGERLDKDTNLCLSCQNSHSFSSSDPTKTDCL